MTSVDEGLQNHLGDTEFPVRNRRRYAAQLDAARRQDQKATGRRALLLTAIAAPAGLVGFAIAMVFYPDGTELANPFISFALGLIAGIVAAAVILQARDAGAPRRAQRDYLVRSERRRPSAHQQQILALDASSDFSIRGWNSSLAFAPTFAELPTELRSRYRDGQEGSPWSALPLHSLQSYRAALDEQFKVASRMDAEVLAADALIAGPHSHRFAEIADGENAERMMSRVAALSGRTVFDVMEMARGRGDEPARLLLAGDIERAVGAIRYAYMADYLSAEEAWALLEPVAAKAFTVYSDWEAYWDDVLVATAFRSDSLDTVQRQRENLAAFRNSSWPAASIPFPG